MRYNAVRQESDQLFYGRYFVGFPPGHCALKPIPASRKFRAMSSEENPSFVVTLSLSIIYVLVIRLTGRTGQGKVCEYN